MSGSQALRSLQTARGVIVDITALATLRMLRLVKVLSSPKYKFALSQGTRTALRGMFANAKMFSAPGGMLTYEDGHHVMYQRTVEEQDEFSRDDDEFISLVEKETEARSGVALAALEPQSRETLEMGFGNYGAEAIMLAADKDSKCNT